MTVHYLLRLFALWLISDGGGLRLLGPGTRTVLLPLLPPCPSAHMTFGRLWGGTELDLLGIIPRLRRCLRFPRLPSQDEDGGDEEEIRASTETSDQTQEDDPGRSQQRENKVFMEVILTLAGSDPSSFTSMWVAYPTCTCLSHKCDTPPVLHISLATTSDMLNRSRLQNTPEPGSHLQTIGRLSWYGTFLHVSDVRS